MTPNTPWPHRTADEAREHALANDWTPEDWNAFTAEHGDHARPEDQWEQDMAAWGERPEAEPDGEVRYPNVDVTLVGVDSHPFSIIAAVTNGLRAAGVKQSERDAFRDEALSGNYDHVIQTAMRWVNVS